MKYILAALLFLAGGLDYAHAANCGAYPYQLTNGQTADANQVMADFNLVRDCSNNNLLGKNNNLSDVQSTATARTNLGLGTSAVENLANSTAAAVTDDGAGNLISHIPQVHSQTFTAGGTFTIPSGATAATPFEFDLVGGGGGGGAGANTINVGTGGGSGGTGFIILTGFSVSDSVTISIGGGGSSGSAGSSTTVAAHAATVATATGGSAGVAGGAGFPQIGGAVGGFSAPGGGGLTVTDSSALGSQPGGANYTGGSTGLSGFGGGNQFGSGGVSAQYSGVTGGVGAAGTRGAGGAGGSGTGNAGGAGGTGLVIVKWVL